MKLKSPDFLGLFMSERRDSNSRPPRWQRDALPAELLSHKKFTYSSLNNR